MSKTVVVRLREAGVTAQFLFEDSIDIIVGDFVVVESERGFDYGQIISEPETLPQGSKKRFKKIDRIMTVDDMRKVKDNKARALDDKKICDKKIREYKLDMKLINAEYSFDRSKIIFYFTAEGRVDFRNLVKDLAKEFKTRIEMRQVGVRDEAKLFGGVGPCGQSLCCSSFLRNFEPVTIKMAKEQNLPLNPSKISGICGRLMCCLGYEHECYKDLKKGLPREGQFIHTEKGKAKILKVYILKGELLVQYEEGAIDRLKYEDLKSNKDSCCCKSNSDVKPCTKKETSESTNAIDKEKTNENSNDKKIKRERDRRDNRRRDGRKWGKKQDYKKAQDNNLKTAENVKPEQCSETTKRVENESKSNDKSLEQSKDSKKENKKDKGNGKTKRSFFSSK